MTTEAPQSVSVKLQQIIQEYPKPDGGVLRVVDGIDLTLDGSQIVMLLGPSGCGKSTVLRMMGGVRPYGVPTPTSGTILIDDKPCDAPHDDAVMVFQQYANRPDLTVRQNVAFPFRLALWRKRIPAAEQQQRIDRPR